MGTACREAPHKRPAAMRVKASQTYAARPSQRLPIDCNYLWRMDYERPAKIELPGSDYRPPLAIACRRHGAATSCAVGVAFDRRALGECDSSCSLNDYGRKLGAWIALNLDIRVGLAGMLGRCGECIAMRSSWPTDWRRVNEAIVRRWSRAGLERMQQNHDVTQGAK